MRFKMNRLCELAGVPLSSRRGRLLRENKEKEDEKDSKKEAKHSKEDQEEGFDLDEMSMDDMYEEDEDDDADEGFRQDLNADFDEGVDDDYMDESLYEDDDEDDADETVEIDEVELVQELRRARRIMQEGKRIAASKKVRRKKALQEAQLKAIIDQEVKNVIKEMDLNLNSGWVYGKRQPKRSKKGYLNHGSFLKGVGFK